MQVRALFQPVRAGGGVSFNPSRCSSEPYGGSDPMRRDSRLPRGGGPADPAGCPVPSNPALCHRIWPVRWIRVTQSGPSMVGLLEERRRSEEGRIDRQRLASDRATQSGPRRSRRRNRAVFRVKGHRPGNSRCGCRASPALPRPPDQVHANSRSPLAATAARRAAPARSCVRRASTSTAHPTKWAAGPLAQRACSRKTVPRLPVQAVGLPAVSMAPSHAVEPD